MYGHAERRGRFDVSGKARGFMSKKVVIVGGGAGGPSSAAEANRRDPSLDITIIEKGEFISYAA